MHGTAGEIDARGRTPASWGGEEESYVSSARPFGSAAAEEDVVAEFVVKITLSG